MSETQFAVIIGTIYLAPHMERWTASTIGCVVLIAAAAKGLGWL